MWKFIGAVRDLERSTSAVAGTSSSDWELIYRTQIPSAVPCAILQLNWHANQGTLGAVTEEGVVVLSEMVMQCGMSGDLVVVQTGSHEVC